MGTDETIRDAVLERLNDEVASVRHSAVNALALQAGNDETIRKALSEKLNDNEYYVRSSAVMVLCSQVEDDGSIRTALLEKLNDYDWRVRQAAVSGLSSQVGRDETIRNALLGSLADENILVRLKVVEELVVGPHAPDLERELGPLLWSWISVDARSGDRVAFNEGLAQRQIAERLGKMLPQNPDLQHRMFALLSEVRWSSRLGAVRTLLAWPGGLPPEVFDRILPVLDDLRGLESYPARLTAASFLINRNESCADAVAVCLEALDYGTEPWEHLPESSGVRKQAALVLGKLEPLRYDPRVYEKLLHVMRDDEDGDVRDAAYDALVRLARVRDEVRT